MTRSLLLSAASGAVALGTALAVPTTAQADPYPPGTFPNGSYRKSCSNLHWKTGDPYVLIANCKPKVERHRCPGVAARHRPLQGTGQSTTTTVS